MSLLEKGRQVRENARRLEEQCKLLTFGAGPARCLGQGFNMLEFFVVLDYLLYRFSFDLEHPEREVPDSRELISGPEPGQIGARIRRRERVSKSPPTQRLGTLSPTGDA